MTTTATWWYDDECSSSLTLSISSAALRPVRAFSTRKPRAVQTRYGWRAWTSLWNPAPVDDRNCDTTLYGIKDVSREKTKRLLVNVIDARGFFTKLQSPQEYLETLGNISTCAVDYAARPDVGLERLLILIRTIPKPKASIPRWRTRRPAKAIPRACGGWDPDFPIRWFMLWQSAQRREALLILLRTVFA